MSKLKLKPVILITSPEGEVMTHEELLEKEYQRLLQCQRDIDMHLLKKKGELNARILTGSVSATFDIIGDALKLAACATGFAFELSIEAFHEYAPSSQQIFRWFQDASSSIPELPTVSLPELPELPELPTMPWQDTISC